MRCTTVDDARPGAGCDLLMLPHAPAGAIADSTPQFAVFKDESESGGDERRHGRPGRGAIRARP